MELKIAVYNVEWMTRLFDGDGNLKLDNESLERAQQLATVVKAMDADIIGIVEGPDTTVSGTKSAAMQLELWARHFDLDPSYRALQGFPSSGRQELCALYKSSIVELSHRPTLDKRKHPFNEPFIADTNEALVKESYEHYRPPFEVSVKSVADNAEVARFIVAHSKSKGIFDRVDFARFEQLSERNRKKLIAECLSIRERCDQWLEDKPERPVFVMGDINDGFGKDYYEQRFSRSAVEILLGDVWYPDKILRSVIPEKPRLGKYGWTPATSRYTDTLTGDTLNVLIDHILVSRHVKVLDMTVWNPYLDQKPEHKQDKVNSMKAILKGASDHYPVSATIVF